MIARGERKLNETVLSTRAADLEDEAKETLKREIMEDLAREQAAKGAAIYDVRKEGVQEMQQIWGQTV